MNSCFLCLSYVLVSTLINWHVMNAVCHLEADCRACQYDTEVLMPED